MNLIRKLFGRQQPAQSDAPQITRWSDDPAGLSDEEVGRIGLESLLGLLIDHDPFYVPHGPSLAICAEFYYSHNPETSSDFIGVYLRSVDFMGNVNNTLTVLNDDMPTCARDDGLWYPRLGPEKMKLLIQPISDGTVEVLGNFIDTSRAEESLHGVGMMLQDDNISHWRVVPIEVGNIPPPPIGNPFIPSFLIISNRSSDLYVGGTFSGPSGPRTMRPVPTEWTIGWGVYRYSTTYKEPNCFEETYTPFWPESFQSGPNWHYLTEDGKGFWWMEGNDQAWASFKENR